VAGHVIAQVFGAAPDALLLLLLLLVVVLLVDVMLGAGVQQVRGK